MTARVVGVDLGATNVRVALVNARGRPERTLKAHVPREAGPEAVARQVAKLCLDAAGGEAPEAVGVGLAGWLDTATGLVHNAPNLGWREVPFGDLLREALDGPAINLTNDLRAIAWGEYIAGAGRGAEELLVVFLGSGIGSSLVRRGELCEGASGIAGEIGHIRVVPSGGRACGCGQTGCLEAYVGGHNIERRVRCDLDTGVKTSLPGYAEGDPETITCGTIDEAARGGDAYCRELWEEVAGYLGQAIGSVITLLNPDRLILGGGVWSGAPLLRDLARDAIARSASPVALECCLIKAPELGDLSGMIGAADLARRRLARGTRKEPREKE